MQGITHRDVKLENLLLASDGTCKLGDFGMAILMQAKEPTAGTGTLDYMAPEVCAGSGSRLVLGLNPAGWHEKDWACFI